MLKRRRLVRHLKTYFALSISDSVSRSNASSPLLLASFSRNLRSTAAMKITALLVLKCAPGTSDPVILANASDVSHFGYFQRSSVKEFVVFVGRTVASRTPPSQRQSVQHEGSSSSTSRSIVFEACFSWIYAISFPLCLFIRLLKIRIGFSI